MNGPKTAIAKHVFIVSLFVLCIYVPFIVGIVAPDNLASSVEKRALAQLPAWPNNTAELKQYPGLFEAYYADQFGLREPLTSQYFKTLQQLDSSNSSHITVGKDGWLFLGSSRKGYSKYQDPIGDATHVNLFTQQQLEQYAATLVEINTWLKQRNISYYFVIAPNKHTIYFDRLPDGITKKSPNSATDQLINYLREHTAVQVVDLRPALIAEKAHRQVYAKGDSHWNHYGGNAAQYAITQKLALDHPRDITPNYLSLDEFTIRTKTTGDLVTLGQLEPLQDIDPEPVFNGRCGLSREHSAEVKTPTSTFSLMCSSKRLNALVFRDSYFNILLPYIGRQFQRSTYVWRAINSVDLEHYVAKESPQVVIHQVLERNFPSVPEFHQAPPIQH